MRTKEQSKEEIRFRRFIRELHRRRKLEQTCEFCNKILETMHHKDEDHTNNRRSNLLNVCRLHHLDIPHDSDSASYIMAEAALGRSSLTWKPARKPFKRKKEGVAPKEIAKTTAQKCDSFLNGKKIVGYLTNLR